MSPEHLDAVEAAIVSSIGTSTIWPSPVRSRRNKAADTAPTIASAQILSPTRLG